MRFYTLGDKNAPAVLFFHAMGVTGESSVPVAKYLQAWYFCIMPTSSVYCPGQKYISKTDEIRQIEHFLNARGVTKLALIAASSLGADIALAFLAQTKLPVEHVFFDGGQFAQMPKGLRLAISPLMYLAIKSFYLSKGKTLKKMLWCDKADILPYFIEAGKAVTYRNLRRQISDSLENKPFPPFSEDLQRRSFWEFGSIEEHFRYRGAVMAAYPRGNFPVFEGHDHMQYQIIDPRGFAEMLISVMERGSLPELPFLRKADDREISY